MTIKITCSCGWHKRIRKVTKDEVERKCPKCGKRIWQTGKDLLLAAGVVKNG